MVEGNQPAQAWPTHNLQQLESVINAAKAADKNLFIWDKQGSVGTFMQYKGMLAELDKMIVRKALGSCSGQEVGESIRKNFVAAMRNGDKLCLDMADKIPTFADYASDGTFDPALFFNFP